MRRRSTAGGEPANTRRRKAATPKRRAAPKAARRRASAAAGEEAKAARLTRERDEALEQQAATSEILGIISRSPADVPPVLDAIVRAAVKLCNSYDAVILLRDGDHLHVAAHHGPMKVDFTSMPISRDWVSGLVVVDRVPVHVRDLAAAGDEFPLGRAIALRLKQRTCLGLPLLRSGEAIGTLFLRRTIVLPFSHNQIALLQTFAAQAVIAIENARLLNELRQRTGDLTESLEQQTAASEVLRVISSSPGELEPVFRAMLENATRICEAKFGTLFRYDGQLFHRVASSGTPPALVEFQKQRGPFKPTGSILTDVVRTKMVAHTADELRDAQPGPTATLGGARSVVGVPMLKDDQIIGAIVIYRQEVRPFSDKQIALVRSFAAQAVIAIENTRLLNELRQRTDDLSEALEQQTATSEVLKVISSSPGDLQAVFSALLENAVRICGAKFGALPLWEGDGFRIGALHNFPPAFAAALQRGPLRLSPNVPVGRMATTKQVVHVADIRLDQSYLDGDPLIIAGAEQGGYRTILAVPMLKENELVGGILIFRQEVRPFTDKQIELVQNFAAQAVIAIENTRLLNELRQRTDDLSESLEQQTATSEVLQVISSSPGELAPVFHTMLQNAIRMCEAAFGILYRHDGQHFIMAAHIGAGPRLLALMQGAVTPHPDTVLGRIAATEKIVAIADARKERGYLEGNPVMVAGVEQDGTRSLLGVPMLKDKALVGALVIFRQEVGSFSDKQIKLVQNFAAQAVIAIENTRLLNELRQRTDDLGEALEQQTATSEVLKVVSSSPGELRPVFEIMLENAVRICGAKFGTLFRFDGKKFYTSAYVGAPPEYIEYQEKRGPFVPPPGAPLEQLLRTKDVVRTFDMSVRRTPAAEFVQFAGTKSHIAVPMLRDNELIGAIVIYNQEVQPFTDKQVELVQNFAAQAVIAIENTRLLNELRESLRQQTATADVLKVISRSTFHLQTVLDTLLKSAAQLCQADHSFIFLRQGEVYRCASGSGDIPEWIEYLKQQTIRPGRGTIAARTALEGHTVHIPDVLADSEYTFLEAQRRGGYRTALGVPLLREGTSVGVMVLTRPTVRPFDANHIALVETFADQAAIAIENVRLFEAEQQRTQELTESLEQQTATSNVLGVISRSAFDLNAVFETVAESSVRLCGADRAFIFRFDGELLRMAVAYNSPPEFKEWVAQHPIRPGRHSGSARAALERRTIHIPDVQADSEYTYGAKDAEMIRTVLGVPILKGDELLGVMMIYHLEGVRPFTDKQIALVETFADQAAIAIENVRLFEAEQQRTQELARSLEHLRTAQDRLVQTQKLASLGQLTAGIAHEIKNPLNFVNNFSGLSVELIDELQATLGGVKADDGTRTEIAELTDTLRGNLEKVIQHGKRADSIVKNMLLHSREGSGQHRPVDINAIVDESLNLAYHGARAEKDGFNITLERSFDPAAGEVDVFPQEITRVLLNLIANGFYAAATRKREGGDGAYEPVLSAATKSLGDHVEITIRDNGTGIPPEVREGTGLGLSISHDIIVKQHSGSIEVDSEAGKFTEMRIVLPRAAVLPAKTDGGAG
jgi:GAF domain-containing protein